MKAPDRYAVIGNPITHSKSPEIHAYFAAQLKQDLIYEPLLAPLNGFVASVRDFIAQGGKGMNVTVPFKLEAYALASKCTARARAAGAVNTLSFDGDAILADNTDGIGLITDIMANAGVAINGKRILLLGAGGAARGVILPLLEQQPSQLVIANRTSTKADQLVNQFDTEGAVVARDFGGLDVEGTFDIVINSTSASMAAELPPIPASMFTKETLAYDMMYGREPTVFMRFSAQHGAQVRDGLGMLIEQAAEAFFIWRGIRPNTAAVFGELRSKLVVTTS